jgi:threonine synthase
MTEVGTSKYYYKCVNCGSEYDASQVRYLCPACEKTNNNPAPPKGVLKTLYRYHKLKTKNITFEKLKKSEFIDLLPVNSISSFPYLKTGNTPLYRIESLNGHSLPFKLFLKDDGQNPTYSFKDRASALVSAFAKERGIDTIIAASTGNAGSSLAGICASQNQKAVIMVPRTAPLAKLTQIIMYGAKIIPVNGTYDDAFDLSVKATGIFGWYNRNTAFNPLTVEGKKSVSFELFAGLNANIPDVIFVPAGDGVIISGVFKGFEDLLKLGIIDKMPLIIAVQAEGSDNLVRNIYGKRFESKPSITVADSISVDFPRNFFMTRDYIVRYKGETVTVTDNEIVEASKTLSRNTGIFSEPAAAAAFAAMLKYQNTGRLNENSNVVVLLTGSGLKDIKTLEKVIKIPPPVNPDINELKNIKI